MAGRIGHRKGLIAVLPAIAAAAVAGAVSTGPQQGTRRPAAPLATAASASRSSHPAGQIGLTEPTKGAGARVKGGTVFFAQAAGSSPNYIFPMYSPEFCGVPVEKQLPTMLYTPLYWFGNNYSPTVDYGQSMAARPVASAGGRVYTIHLKHYKWSDGERVSADDLVFWMNMLEASPATEWCNTAPGLFPYNVKSYRAVNPSTFEITFKRAYNPTWVLYNELSELTPLPLAWDRTSLTAPAPKTFRHSAGASVKGAGRVYSFLNAQSKDSSKWASSPLWRVVDGPFRLTGFTSTGRVTLVPNKQYSGSPKPSISKLVELPFTSDNSLFNEIRSSGPSAVTIAGLPVQDQPQATSVVGEGYELNKAAPYSFNYMALNLNNPKLGPVFRQRYFREAFQHLVDQTGWIRAILHGAAVPTYGPVPSTPTSPLVSVPSGGNPYAFSVSAASRLLATNGWKVMPGQASSCVRPGTHKGECGAGITKGEKISFTLNYLSGVVATQTEMQNLQAEAKRVGIQISLTAHDYNQVVATAVHCSAKQSACSWQAANWGAGWNYGTDYFPTGALLLASGSIEDLSNYDSARMNKLIARTLTAPASRTRAVMEAYARYAENDVPVVYEPTSIGTFSPSDGVLVAKRLGGYTANAFGLMTPQYWYFTK